MNRAHLEVTVEPPNPDYTVSEISTNSNKLSFVDTSIHESINEGNIREESACVSENTSTIFSTHIIPDEDEKWKPVASTKLEGLLSEGSFDIHNDPPVALSFRIPNEIEGDILQGQLSESLDIPIAQTEDLNMPDVSQIGNLDSPNVVQIGNFVMPDIMQTAGENEMGGSVDMTEIAGTCNFDQFLNSGIPFQNNITEIKLPYLIEALKKCGEIKYKTRELLQKGEEKDASEIKLDLKTKAQINKAFVDLRRANREANIGRRDEKVFKTKAKDTFDEAQYRLLEVGYRKTLLDFDLEIIRFKEPKYHKISLISVEEFLSTAPNDFTNPLFKYQNISSSGSERQRYEHNLLLQRLRYEKSERELLEDEKIQKLSRKRDLKCIIEKKLNSAYQLDVSLKECIRRIDQCGSLREALESLESRPSSLPTINDDGIDNMDLDHNNSHDAKRRDIGCVNPDKEEGELIQ